MSKTGSPSNVSPGILSLGQDILGDTRFLTLHQAQNYAAGVYGECHLSTCVDGFHWDDHAAHGDLPAGSSLTIAAMGLTFTGSFVSVLVTDLWIEPEQALGQIECASECVLDAGEGVTVRYTLEGSVAAVNVDVNCTSSSNGDEKAVLQDCDAFTTGGEWVTLTITLRRT
ncbi:MAG: hypothetical protein E6Q97_35720, partial [Desulfurellales bacterium]